MKFCAKILNFRVPFRVKKTLLFSFFMLQSRLRVYLRFPVIRISMSQCFVLSQFRTFSIHLFEFIAINFITSETDTSVPCLQPRIIAKELELPTGPSNQVSRRTV
jgi:hypothetical protein